MGKFSEIDMLTKQLEEAQNEARKAAVYRLNCTMLQSTVSRQAKELKEAQAAVLECAGALLETTMQLHMLEVENNELKRRLENA